MRGARDAGDLNAHPPVSRLNVLRRLIARSGFYRLKTPDAEQQNAPLEINPDTDRSWRERIVSVGISPQAPLRLHVEWIPR
jgi:hypothetical protein